MAKSTSVPLLVPRVVPMPSPGVTKYKMAELETTVLSSAKCFARNSRGQGLEFYGFMLTYIIINTVICLSLEYNFYFCIH